MGKPILLIEVSGDVYLRFQSKGGSPHFGASPHELLTNWFLRFISECDTCLPLDGQYGGSIHFLFQPEIGRKEPKVEPR